MKPTWESNCGTVRLYHDDCRNVLPFLSGVAAVITDPPYGDRDTHDGHLSQVTLRDGTPARQALGFEGITEAEMLDMAGEWVQVASGWCVFTCEWKFCRALDDAELLVRHGIWRKRDGAPQFTGDRPGTGWEAVAICHRPDASGGTAVENTHSGTIPRGRTTRDIRRGSRSGCSWSSSTTSRIPAT